MKKGFWVQKAHDVWEGRGNLLEREVWGVASLFYGWGVAVHKRLYDWGFRERRRFGVPVVSVGNITVGGTGKTPLVASLAREMRERGVRVVVVSRGYGGGAEEEVLVVSRGDGPLVDAGQGGDEPIMLAKALKGVPVVVARRKVWGVEKAVEELGAELVLVDDGFQHWPLARDLDVVLVDGERGFGNGKLLPAGPLREPVEALKRAHLLVVTKRRNPSLLRFLGELAPRADLFEVPWKPVELWSTHGGSLSVEALKGVKVGAFAGIAHPASFFRLLEELGARLQWKRAFPDHHNYDDRDLGGITPLASGVDMVVTTEKDWVRLEKKGLPFPLWVLRVAPSLPRGFTDRILEKLGWGSGR